MRSQNKKVNPLTLVLLPLAVWVQYPPLAAAEPVLQLSKLSSSSHRLAELVGSGRHEEAYQLATKQAAAEEGEPDFDLHYGLAALESGRPEEASFIFERLVAAYPENDRFRLEYARALFLMQRLDEAEEQFRVVLEHNPPATVVGNIERFLERIDSDRRNLNRRWEGGVELGLGYDSNINNATTERVIGLFQLPDSALELDSPFLSAATSLRYHQPFSQRQRAFLQVQTDHKHNSEQSEFNLDSAGLTGAWIYQQGDSQLQAGLQYQHTWLDGEEYQSTAGLFAQLRQFWGSQWATSLYAGLLDKNSLQLEELDALQPILSGQVQWLQSSLLHQFSMGGGTENPRLSSGRHLAKNFVFASYQLLWQLTPEWQPYANLSASIGHHKADHPVFADRREDDSLSLTAGVQTRLSEAWRATLEAGYTDNQSTLALYEYDRWRIEARIKFGF